MKSSIHRSNRRRNNQPVTVINDTKYVSKISERIIPRRRFMKAYDLDHDTTTNFFSLYRIICAYIFLTIGILIGGGGIAICIVYYNSDENTQNWKIGGIILSAITCIVAIILMVVTILKQTRNKPWRHQAKDILLRPENYFSEESEHSSSEDYDDDDDDGSKSQSDIIDHSNETIETNASSMPNTSFGLLKTVHNDLVYCLVCNHLHPTTEECKTPIRTNRNLPPLQRSKSYHPQPNSNAIQIKEKSLKKNKSQAVIDRSIKYALSNETQTDVLGNKTDNLILRRIPLPTAKALVQQPTTKIMIVRVPKVAGELVIQPTKH